MAWENSENSDFPWKYHKYPHIFCPASLEKMCVKWDTLMVISYKDLEETKHLQKSQEAEIWYTAAIQPNKLISDLENYLETYLDYIY